jgi:hypothetical protein
MARNRVIFTFTLDVKVRELCGLVTLMQETTLLPTNAPVSHTQPPIQMVPKDQRVELTIHPYPVPVSLTQPPIQMVPKDQRVELTIHPISSACVPHPAPNPNGTKGPESRTDHSPVFSAYFTNPWNYIPFLLYVFHDLTLN